LKDFSTVLFDVTAMENSFNHFGNHSKYKVSPTFDPAIKLLSQITNNDNLDIGFKFYSIGEESLYVFSPTPFLPLHFSLRIRDSIEEQNIKTATIINDFKQLNLGQKAKIVTFPFKFVLDTDQISILKLSNSDISDCINLLEEDKRQRTTEIKNIINCWNRFSEAEQVNMLNTFYHDYYRLYIDGPCHRNTITFNVHDKDWNLADLDCMPDVNNHVNTAAQLIKFSKYRHSSVKGYYISGTAGGALSINNYCPGIAFLDSLEYPIDRDYIGSNVAMRHSQTLDHTKPVDSHDRCVDLLYAFNGFIPYWMVIYLKEACDAFGIKTSELTIPNEMKKLSKEIDNSNLRLNKCKVNA